MKGETTNKKETKEDKFDWWRNKAIESRKTHPRKRYIFGNKNKKTKGVIPSQEGYD